MVKEDYFSQSCLCIMMVVRMMSTAQSQRGLTADVSNLPNDVCRVLLVDDHSLILETMSFALGDMSGALMM